MEKADEHLSSAADLRQLGDCTLDDTDPFLPLRRKSAFGFKLVENRERLIQSFPRIVPRAGCKLVKRHDHVDLPLRVGWVPGGEPATDVTAFAIRAKRFPAVPERNEHVANPIEAHRQIALPSQIAWIPGGERATNFDALAKGGECSARITLCRQHVPYLLQAHGQIALPAHVAWVRGGEGAQNIEALAICRKRTANIASRVQHVGHLALADRDITSPLRHSRGLR